MLLLDVVEERAITAWRTALDQADRDLWKSNGTGWAGVTKLRDTYVSLLRSLRALAPRYAETRDAAAMLGVANDEIDGSPSVQLLVDLVQGGDLHDEDEMTTLAQKVEEHKKGLLFLPQALGHLSKAYEGADEQRRGVLRKFALRMLRADIEGVLELKPEWRKLLDSDRVALPAPGAGTEVAASLGRVGAEAGERGGPLRVFSSYVVDAAAARSVAEGARALFAVEGMTTEYAVPLDDAAAEALEFATDRPDVRRVEASDVDPARAVVFVSSSAEPRQDASIVDITVPAADAAPAPTLPGPTAQSLLAQHQQQERLYSYLAAGLTILGGMAAVYFPSPAFGSSGDYATALLWGSAVGKGADIVAKYLAAR